MALPDRLGMGVSRSRVDATLQVARLDTHVENIPARKLYERHGFIDLGCHPVATRART